MKKRKRDYEEDLHFDEIEKDDNEIDIMDLVFILLRRWKLIILTAIPIIILGVAFAMTRPNIYKSEATLMVSSKHLYNGNNLEHSEISRNQKLVTSYTQIARSKSIMINVINKLDLDMTPEQVASLVQVTPVSDTEFIKISYTDQNSQRAAMLVNEVSVEFIDRIKTIMQFENLNIVEKARVATQSQPKKRSLILAASIVLGFMLGVFIAFVLEFLHSKLRKPDDMEKIMGYPVLANIPNFNGEGEK